MAYDLYNIEGRLKEMDPNILRIDFDYDKELHEIIAVDKLGTQYVAMTVKHGELDSRVITRMQEIDPRRGFRPFDELMNWMDQKAHNDEKKVEDMARDFAETIHRPLVEDYCY